MKKITHEEMLQRLISIGGRSEDNIEDTRAITKYVLQQKKYEKKVKSILNGNENLTPKEQLEKMLSGEYIIVALKKDELEELFEIKGDD